MTLLILGLTGCGWFGSPDTGDSDRPPKDRPDDSDTDDSDDSDDSDTDDSDTDTGPNDTGDGLCDRSLSEAAPSNECVSASVSCGETVEATLAGGLSDWVAADYTGAFCFTNFEQNDYEGPERIFALELAAGTNATVTLHTPCADLDLSAVRWERDLCPDAGDPLSDCEGSDDAGDDSVSFSWDDTSHWLIIVDAKTAADGDANFRVSVECSG